MKLRRTLLRPLVPVYALALAAQRLLRSTGRSRARRLPEAVISIGSLSAGGAGKTPVVLALARILDARGYAVRILTRGYGRRGKGVERVDPLGDAIHFGDEPLLLAQRSGVPVFVGASRFQAGLLSQQLSSEKKVVYLLDDGFQHRHLARDLDIVLLTQEDVDDVLLPAGNLREPLTRLREADVLVLREEELAPLETFLRVLHRDGDRRPGTAINTPAVWVVRRRLEFSVTDGARRPERPLAFCGIARPEGFLSMLRETGLSPIGTVLFADHHRYSERDVERLAQRAATLQADVFLTTEKDAIKLTPAMRSRLERVGPLLVPRLVVDLLDEKNAVEQMIGKVNQLDRRRRTPSRA